MVEFVENIVWSTWVKLAELTTAAATVIWGS